MIVSVISTLVMLAGLALIAVLIGVAAVKLLVDGIREVRNGAWRVTQG
jgi:hypothetical protein